MAQPVFEVFTGAKRQLGPTRHLIGLQLDGTEALTAALQRLGTRAPAAMAGALFREGERIMAESKQEVPVETGALRASGQVALPDIAGDHIVVELGYGNASVGYAVVVHEDLMAQHTVGRAKYLEDPMLRAARDMETRLAAELLELERR